MCVCVCVCVFRSEGRCLVYLQASIVSLLSEICSDGQRGIGGQTAPPTSMTGTNSWLKMVCM